MKGMPTNEKLAKLKGKLSAFIHNHKNLAQPASIEGPLDPTKQSSKNVKFIRNVLNLQHNYRRTGKL